jgi:hypothetical protein
MHEHLEQRNVSVEFVPMRDIDTCLPIEFSSRRIGELWLIGNCIAERDEVSRRKEAPTSTPARKKSAIFVRGTKYPMCAT